jgi:hypothetical protein
LYGIIGQRESNGRGWYCGTEVSKPIMQKFGIQEAVETNKKNFEMK